MRQFGQEYVPKFEGILLGYQPSSMQLKHSPHNSRIPHTLSCNFINSNILSYCLYIYYHYGRPNNFHWSINTQEWKTWREQIREILYSSKSCSTLSHAIFLIIPKNIDLIPWNQIEPNNKNIGPFTIYPHQIFVQISILFVFLFVSTQRLGAEKCHKVVPLYWFYCVIYI